MMSQEITIEEVSKIGLSEAKRLGCDDVSVICTKSNDSQVRFANNVITLVNNVRNLTMEIVCFEAEEKNHRSILQSHEAGNRKICRKPCEILRSFAAERRLCSTATRPVHLQWTCKF